MAALLAAVSVLLMIAIPAEAEPPITHGAEPPYDGSQTAEACDDGHGDPADGTVRCVTDASAATTGKLSASAEIAPDVLVASSGGRAQARAWIEESHKLRPGLTAVTYTADLAFDLSEGMNANSGFDTYAGVWALLSVTHPECPECYVETSEQLDSSSNRNRITDFDCPPPDLGPWAPEFVSVVLRAPDGRTIPPGTVVVSVGLHVEAGSVSGEPFTTSACAGAKATVHRIVAEYA